MITLDDIIKEIETARLMAIEERKPTAMLQASLAKAKLLGLDKGEPDPSQDRNFKISFVSPDGQVTSQALAEFRQVAQEVLQKV